MDAKRRPQRRGVGRAASGVLDVVRMAPSGLGELSSRRRCLDGSNG